MGGRRHRGGIDRPDGRRLVLAYVDRHALPAGVTGWDFADVFQNAVNLGVPVLGFVLASRRPENRMGWLFLVAGLALGLNAFAAPYGLHAVRVAPGSLPAGLAVAWLSNWVFVIQAAMLAFLLLLFPTGRMRSRRWRTAVWFVATVYTSVGLALIVRATRFWAHPFRPFPDGLYPWVLTAILILLPATFVISVVALVVRFALSSGDERLQLKWFAAAALLVVTTTSVSTVTNSLASNVLQNLAFLCLYAALGIAVLKYRLYEIDVVISKAVLYGSLAVFITAVYAGLVVGVGALAGIAKYAKATEARICLRAQNGTLRFTVSDDGTGYDTSHTPIGSGQRNMADRLAALGGRLEVSSVPNHGTTHQRTAPRPRHQRRPLAHGRHRSGSGLWEWRQLRVGLALRRHCLAFGGRGGHAAG